MGVLGIYYIQVNICQFYQIIYLISFYLFFINICLYLNEFAERTIYIYIWSLFTTTTPIPPPPPQKKSKFTFLLPCFEKEKFDLFIVKTFLFYIAL